MELFLAPRAGIWCRNASGWEDFRAALAAPADPAGPVDEPFPELLPARERRRAPLHVRLALEAGLQACRENGVGVAEVATVFASAMSDVQITEYLCRTLAGPAPVLSPTRFHNSVHNAASGYWSIGAANRLASTAVAAQDYTFPTALLEAAALAIASRSGVLLVAHDVAAQPPLDAVCPNRQPFAAGVLITAVPVVTHWLPVRVTTVAHTGGWPELPVPWLQRLAAENPSARGVALLAALAGAADWPVVLPIGPASGVRIERRAPGDAAGSASRLSS
ncbi:MAG: beta-ketoacyl synthase chain length factor [Gammaproteobacteria bacterium]|nr:beta-ketoacyl synthase chain length factor [Gammaproteobacteria bacterium]